MQIVPGPFIDCSGDIITHDDGFLDIWLSESLRKVGVMAISFQ